MNEALSATRTNSSASTWIVGIGASAGGVEALNELMSRLPVDLGLAYLVVVHLDRTHPSHLAEILGKATRMPVVAAADSAAIERNCVYVIAPNTNLSVSDGRLTVTERSSSEQHMPIDDLFGSLAHERGPGSIAVVLSGTGTDGSFGVTEIKAAGGITFAQDTSAKFDGMPKNAIGSGAIDFVMSPADIAGELQRIANSPYPKDLEEREGTANEDDWKRLFRMLRGMSGVDFSCYKRTTIRRRLVRRMALRRAETLARYLTVLQQDPAEMEALYQDLLIRVTSFFRDPPTYDALAEIVFPRIMQARKPRDPIRIWVPGCSTGEEVYSIAIALLEFLGEAADQTPVQIFGTDVNARSIERARAGRYLVNLFVGVPPERVNRFFTRSEGIYEVNKMVRDLCIFAEHNVARDPPFSKLDVVSCRNVLIYLDATMQKRVLGLFHYALNPDRFLLLGPSETAGVLGDMFEVVDAKRKIYRRLGSATHSAVDARYNDGTLFKRPRSIAEPSGEMLDLDHLQREADHMLLARYAPAGILIDHRLNVLQFRGSTGRFLEHQPGSASLTLGKLVRPALLVELSSAINEARNTGVPVRRDDLRNEREAGDTMNVEVIPLNTRPDHARCFMILFDAKAPGPAARPEGDAVRGLLRRLLPARTQANPSSPEAREREELKREIEATRTYLQAIIEANEAAQEELRSANEEVLSANEEFQSTNEELETAKEELQSANEELATTNEELRHRNLELSDLNVKLRKARDYSQAIVETIPQPLLLLDSDLRVRRVNRAFCETFHLTRADAENCLLSELGEGEWNTQPVRDALAGVSRGATSAASFEVRRSFSDAGERIFRTDVRKLQDDPQHGELLFLSVEDTTDRDRATRMLAQQAAIIDNSPEAIILHDLNGPIRRWNKTAADTFGWASDEAIGKSAELLLKTRRQIAYQDVESALARDGWWECEQVHTARDGRQVTVRTRYLLLNNTGADPLVLEIDRIAGA